MSTVKEVSPLITKLRALREKPSPEVDALKSSLVRRMFKGSCHCRRTQYLVHLLVPTPETPKADLAEYITASQQEVYRCDCSTCTKLGLFHIRPADPPSGFAVLSPVDENGLIVKKEGAEDGLKTYRCNEKRTDWYFCGNCGVRCFAIRADFEVAEMGLPAEVISSMEDIKTLGEGEGETIKVRVWKPKKEGWSDDHGGSYLSVNMTSLDQGQEGMDMREWHERGWIGYLHMSGSSWLVAEKPFPKGMY